MFDFNILSIIAGLPGLLIAMVVHEYAHAQVADWMGDDTPRMTGRLTLNPVAHIDPVGLIMLLVAQFGWAKPVMINPGNFRNWRKGEICVSLAGPMSNLYNDSPAHGPSPHCLVQCQLCHFQHDSLAAPRRFAGPHVLFADVVEL